MSRAKRRSHRKLQRVNRAKAGLVYTRTGVIELYGIHPDTLTHWIRDGLNVSTEGRRQFFRGDDLNAFHRARRDAARWPCEGGQLPCFRCRSGVLPAENAATIGRQQGALSTIRWTCSRCSGSWQIYTGKPLENRLRAAGITLNSRNENGDSLSGTSLT